MKRRDKNFYCIIAHRNHDVLPTGNSWHFKRHLIVLGLLDSKSYSLIQAYLQKGKNSALRDSAGKQSACNAADLGSIPGLGRTPEEGKGSPLQYPGLENSMDCIVMGSQRIGHDCVNFTFTFQRTDNPNFLKLDETLTTSPKLNRGGYEGRLRGRGLLVRSNGFEGTIGPVMEKRGERFWGNKRTGKMQACCTCGRGGVAGMS